VILDTEKETMTKEQEMDAETIGDEATLSRLTRRGFLAASGVVAAGVVLAACGNDDDEGDTGDDDDDADGGDASEGDLGIAAFAASLEVLAVNTYEAGLAAATAGKLGDVPPAVAEYATTAMGHHQEHLDAWNGILASADGQAVTAPPPDLEAVVNEKFGKVKDVVGLARLALELEMIAADTYLAALPSLEGAAATKLAGSIQAVDRQHQSILHFALGENTVPIVFQTTENAASPA
jgi:hypothetical protein